ncbi:hypothetical protein BBK14_13560 [Parafrankia soli]|uniref:Peptidase M41 domain-containing protein n=1 Tax=Parafrankia soli TaxID=2599596 RepID=A0A1S1QYC2_9ACTN|nr:hypothetical protein [Parafrankia soli]OHV39693.1 hypothetical protein BBK14_13560 [Parafrankia soli]
MSKDHRRIVAVHEAGHWLAAREYAARGVQATLTTTPRGGARGITTLRRWRGSDLQFVAYTLAGATAARLITGDAGLHGSDDLQVARTVCRNIHADISDAEHLAATLVRTHRRHIERAARQLYDTGRI